MCRNPEFWYPAMGNSRFAPRRWSGPRPADNGEGRAVQKDPLRHKRPARVRVEDGDDNGHVCASDGHGEGDAHDAGDGGGGADPKAKAKTNVRCPRQIPRLRNKFAVFVRIFFRN